MLNLMTLPGTGVPALLTPQDFPFIIFPSFRKAGDSYGSYIKLGFHIGKLWAGVVETIERAGQNLAGR